MGNFTKTTFYALIRGDGGAIIFVMATILSLIIAFFAATFNSPASKWKRTAIFFSLLLSLFTVIIGCLYLFKPRFLMNIIEFESPENLASSLFGLATIIGLYYIMLQNNSFAEKRLEAENNNTKERILIEYRNELIVKMIADLRTMDTVIPSLNQTFLELKNKITLLKRQKEIEEESNQTSTKYLTIFNIGQDEHILYLKTIEIKKTISFLKELFYTSKIKHLGSGLIKLTP